MSSSNFRPVLPKRVAAAVERVLQNNPAVRAAVTEFRRESGAWRDAVVGSTPVRDAQVSCCTPDSTGQIRMLRIAGVQCAQ